MKRSEVMKRKSRKSEPHRASSLKASDFTFNINECAFTDMFLFTVISKVISKIS